MYEKRGVNKKQDKVKLYLGGIYTFNLPKRKQCTELHQKYT